MVVYNEAANYEGRTEVRVPEFRFQGYYQMRPTEVEFGSWDGGNKFVDIGLTCVDDDAQGVCESMRVTFTGKSKDGKRSNELNLLELWEACGLSSEDIQALQGVNETEDDIKERILDADIIPVYVQAKLKPGKTRTFVNFRLFPKSVAQYEAAVKLGPSVLRVPLPATNGVSSSQGAPTTESGSLAMQ